MLCKNPHSLVCSKVLLHVSFKKKKNPVNKNQGCEPIQQKYKANENTNRHKLKKKQKQTINTNQIKTLYKEDSRLQNNNQR
jgi:hypothetical protein